MSIQNNYEINVSVGNRHWCKIQLPDCLEGEAEMKFETLKSLFGDHFHLEMTYWECEGRTKREWGYEGD